MTGADSDLDVAIRRLWSFDQQAIRDHFLRLDAKSRQMRFGGGTSDAFVADYAGRILKIDAIVYGAFVEGELRAVAELRGLLDNWPVDAEAAFSVEAAWQNHGIGDQLVARVFAAARNRGVKTLHMICLRSNQRMQHLAVKHNAVLSIHTDNAEATLDPPWPTPCSVAEELIDETSSFIRAVFQWRGHSSA